MLIYKSCPLEKSNLSKQGKIKGYASVFDNKDAHSDVMMAGCFDKTLKESKGVYPLLFNHKNQVGVNLKAKQDDVGLKVESLIFKDEPDLTEAKACWALINKALEFDLPMGLSIGGRVKKWNYNTDRQVYEILEFDLMEHSVTATPANKLAQITNVKFLEKDENYQNAVSSSKNDLELRKIKQEFSHMFEKEIKELYSFRVSILKDLKKISNQGV